MKLRLWSDLHLEFTNNKFSHIWKPSPEDKDITLLLAGDIGVGLGARLFIETLCANFKYVLFVCGNHEFYGNDITDIRKRWRTVEEEIPNFHFLDNEYRILDGVRFLGGTMWTGLDNNNHLVWSTARRTMNDYRSIQKDRIQITPDTTIEEHSLFVKFLLEKFDEEFAGPTVVMTHHSPGNVQRSEYGTGLLNYAYFAELENMIGNSNKASLWVHGHTHKNADYVVNETRVVCNPYGYHGHEVNPSFDNNIILEV